MGIIRDLALLHDQCYIDGKWVSAKSGAVFPVINPAEGTVITTVPFMGINETNYAVTTAERAWFVWRGLLAKERSVILHRWYQLIIENIEDLATLISIEQGKPKDESRAEVSYGATFIEWYAEEGKRVYGDIISSYDTDKRIIVVKQSVGVMAAITPWNFPLAMVTRKVAPALAVGCTVLVKPSEDTPLSALALAELAHRAGFPHGVFNVITGAPEIVGSALVTHPVVRKVSFTGSTAVGKLLMRQCSNTVKKISLELGGNAPFVVFNDANISLAAAGAVASKYRNSGQTCVCANRFFIQEEIYNAFASKLAEMVGRLIIGSGLDSLAQQGPLINIEALNKIEWLVDDAVSKGAKVVVGGKRLSRTFFEPTILTEVTYDMELCHEEIFGPIAPLYRFQNEDHIIRVANDTRFGLAAYFYTRDIGRVWRVSEALEYGMIGVNTGIISTEIAPFGGMKESGIGREGSKYGINDYLEIKYLCIGGINL